MYKVHYGNITIDIIRNSWEWAYSNKIIPQGTLHFILDYREARLDFSPRRYDDIINYYKLKPEYFAGKRFAIISDNPHNVAISTLIHRDENGYDSKPFSTIDAAIKWLKR
jgi:hypothetical protein